VSVSRNYISSYHGSFYAISKVSTAAEQRIYHTDRARSKDPKSAIVPTEIQPLRQVRRNRDPSIQRVTGKQKRERERERERELKREGRCFSTRHVTQRGVVYKDSPLRVHLSSDTLSLRGRRERNAKRPPLYGGTFLFSLLFFSRE